MITEKRYKNALKIVEEYRKQERVKNRNFEGITLETPLRDIRDRISVRLADVIFGSYYPFMNERLVDLTKITKKEISRYYQVGNSTVEEFIALMDAAGHTVLDS